MGTLLRIVLGLTAGGGLLWLGFVWSFRTKNPVVHGAIRRLNRRVTNPKQLQTAGQPGAYASVVHHTGRRSGTAYRTPVVVQPAGDALFVALPYGPGADWVQNVLSAGGATIEHEGATLHATDPRLVPVEEANPHFPVKEQRMHRVYGVRDVLWMTHADA